MYTLIVMYVYVIQYTQGTVTTIVYKVSVSYTYI